jgi:hypothetical protein
MIPKTCRESAVALVQRGFAVFPLQFRTKEPLPKSKGFYDATTDERLVRRLWSGQVHNVGVRTGIPIDDLFLGVLDIDSPEAASLLASLEAKHGKLPETFTVRTARGEHRYLRSPDLKSRTGFLPGLDFKCRTAYVVGPNSFHPSKAVYTCVDWDAPVAEAPAWLVDTVAAASETIPIKDRSSEGIIVVDRWVQAAVDRELAELRAAMSGRNTTLSRVAFKLAQFVHAGLLDEGPVWKALEDATDLPEKERDGVIRRAFRHAKTKPRISLEGVRHAAR